MNIDKAHENFLFSYITDEMLRKFYLVGMGLASIRLPTNSTSQPDCIPEPDRGQPHPY